MVGVTLILGGETTPNRAVVQIAGGAFRMRANLLGREFARGGAFQHSLLRYTQALITQISQTAVCNCLHPLAERLSRWLLLCHDRAESDELLMTQDFIANMLGGRRESVTVAACHLQDAGLIQYTRGHIRIIDRKRLEGSACECYRIVKNECERLLRPSRRSTSTSSGGLWKKTTEQSSQLIEIVRPGEVDISFDLLLSTFSDRLHRKDHNRNTLTQFRTLAYGRSLGDRIIGRAI
jgi:Crp-like helix-turn-helix domain